MLYKANIKWKVNYETTIEVEADSKEGAADLINDDVAMNRIEQIYSRGTEEHCFVDKEVEDIYDRDLEKVYPFNVIAERIGFKKEWSSIEYRGMKDYCKEWLKDEFHLVGFNNFSYHSYGERAELCVHGDFYIENNDKLYGFAMLNNDVVVAIFFDKDERIIYKNIDQGGSL